MTTPRLSPPTIHGQDRSLPVPYRYCVQHLCSARSVSCFSPFFFFFAGRSTPDLTYSCCTITHPQGALVLKRFLKSCYRMHHRSKQAVQILGVFVTNCLRRNKQDLTFIERSLDSKEKKSLLGRSRYWEGGGKRKRGTIYLSREANIRKP